MALEGQFDPLISPIAWFDDNADPLGWFNYALAQDDELIAAGGAATSYTFTGPSSGALNVASTDFTVTPDGTSTATVTPATDGSGSFTPATVTFSGSGAQTFTYTPTSTVGSPHTLSVTNDGGLSDPASIDYTVVSRTTKNTRAFPLGMEIGMNWVMGGIGA